ncbi:MAG: hypothetical protein NUV45_15255 [Tepidanaerobacteraceae bacterium]|jgi:hypothetical protein|nr:hypothetical protein [Tepidanaerobacteraceae bacterium]
MIKNWLRNEYSLESPPIYISGWVFKDSSQFNKYLCDRVYAKLIDVEGQNEIKELLQDMASTGFLKQNLARVIEKNIEFEPWEIGEALAQCFLEDQFKIIFPWNTRRDARVLKASLPGADLVGFIVTENGIRFAFGEVKTSEDVNAPPKVMYGRSGMSFQLEKLKNDKSLRSQLFFWLGCRAKGAKWENQFKEAAIAYLNNDRNVFLYGILIRDTSPTLKDLESSGNSLVSGANSEIIIYLYAYYLPIPIQMWPDIIKTVGFE